MQLLWLNCPSFCTSTISFLCLLNNNPNLNIIFQNILINIHQNKHSYVVDSVFCPATDTMRSKHETTLGSCSPSLWYVGIQLCVILPHLTLKANTKMEGAGGKYDFCEQFLEFSYLYKSLKITKVFDKFSMS